jgi:hypothetical protein
MQTYGTRGSSSGVSHYEIGPNYIHLQFREDPRIFVYTDKRPGLAKVVVMQHLAMEGEGLTEFVHEQVSGDYETWFVPGRARKRPWDILLRMGRQATR